MLQIQSTQDRYAKAKYCKGINNIIHMPLKHSNSFVKQIIWHINWFEKQFCFVVAFENVSDCIYSVSTVHSWQLGSKLFMIGFFSSCHWAMALWTKLRALLPNHERVIARESCFVAKHMFLLWKSGIPSLWAEKLHICILSCPAYLNIYPPIENTLKYV